MNRSAKVWAIVPIKRFADAKRRLAPVLDAGERAKLARLMVEDVLDVLLPCAGVLAGTVVVTADVDAAALAQRLGATVVFDDSDNGINAAVARAVAHIGGEGAGIVVVPSDIPQLSPQAIVSAAAAIASPRTLAIAAASEDGGTNLLACRPAGVLPLRFGPRSFDRHYRAALEAGITVRMLRLPELSLDIDRPENLRAFLALKSKTRTHAFLSTLGVRARLEQRERLERRPAGCAAAGA